MKNRRPIWCEKVIRDRHIRSSALAYTSEEKPYGPPMTNTRRLIPLFIIFFKPSAKPSDVYSFPRSSRSITLSPVRR